MGKRDAYMSFNTQPPKGGWHISAFIERTGAVSTHSRLKAAGVTLALFDMRTIVSTHSRLKAAGGALAAIVASREVSTHSRLKAAGQSHACLLPMRFVSTHSRLKAAGTIDQPTTMQMWLFQHTAA